MTSSNSIRRAVRRGLLRKFSYGDRTQFAALEQSIEGKTQSRTHLLTVPFVLAVGLAGWQSTTLAADADEKISEVIVTGSRISRTDAETASPIETLTREDLDRTGQQNISDILRSISAEGQGTLPNSFTAGFASGASSVSLRGLGVNATLVLVNGRRMVPYGLADDGTRVFTDLNTLPLEAVERVEVLKDGASAVYGSDAIAGVVNVILRKTFQGVNVAVNAGTSYKDDGSTVRLAATYGFGDLASDKYNVYFTVEGSKQDAINNTQRDKWLRTENLTQFGFFDNRAGSNGAGRGNFDVDQPNIQTRTPYGTVRLPGGDLFQRVNLTPCPELGQVDGVDVNGNPIKSNVCLFDRAGYNQIQPDTRRFNLFARGTFDFTDTLEGYVELGVFKSKTTFIGPPTGFDDPGPKYCNTNSGLVCDPFITTLPGGLFDNPFPNRTAVRYLATDIGGRNGNNDSEVTRSVVGLNGQIVSDWNWTTGAAYIDSRLNQTRTGFVLGDVLQADLNNGSYRINHPSLVSAATYAAISPTLSNTARNSLELIDASITGSLAQLPGGKLGLAVGAEWRHEKTDSPPTPFTDTGRVIGLGYSAFTSDRKVTAGYVELNAPIVAMLDIEAAYRYDRYSDFGKSTTPKLGIKFRPISQLAVRGTYSEGFRAPGPAEAGNSASFGFTSIGILSIGNPNLKPEESKSYTFGVVFEPFDGTSASIDYYKIDRRNEINQADPAVIVGNLPTTGTPNSQRPGAVPGSTLYYDIDGNLATATVPYTNANKTTTSGVDFDVRQKFNLGSLGTLETSVSWTYIDRYRKLLDDGTEFNYVGTQGPYVLSSATGTPRNRGDLVLTWKHQDLALTARVNYVGSMKLIDHQGVTLVDNGDGTFSTSGGEGTAWAVRNGVDGAPACGVYNPDGTVFHNCESGSFMTVDAFGSLKLGDHLEVTGSISNLLNKMALFNPYTYGGLNYNPAWTQSGAVGRYVTAGARYKF